MESNNNNNNNNDGGDKHQQLGGSAQTRKSNKLANDEDKPAEATGEDQNCSSNKNLKEGNDLDLEVESLSREELIKLVRKQMATIMEMKAQKQLETIKKEAEQAEEETSTITAVDLPPSSRVPLPLELNCEIFKCLKLPVQRSFIWGLGRDIYGMFGQKLLKKTKRVQNQHGNRWKGTNTTKSITADGLKVRNNSGVRTPKVFAEQSFPTSGRQYRLNGFPGTICYYYEVEGFLLNVGLSDGAIPADDNSMIGHYSNSYAIQLGYLVYQCWLAGERHQLELPEGAIRPAMKEGGCNVYGCGLELDPNDKLWIFFTLNGKLMGQKIPINPTVDQLFPVVKMQPYVTFVSNFGDDPAKPFEYDIKN